MVDTVNYVYKNKCSNGDCFIRTTFKNIVTGSLELLMDSPYFNNDMFKGMKLYKEYTLEELGIETEPAVINNFLYYMKQNGVFDEIKGLWLGNYEHESNITLEEIVKEVLGDEYSFPIIKSNNFGHCETKTVIPIGTRARINTNEIEKIKLIEKCVK